MATPILVKIVGAPIACKDGIKDTWRDVADWVSAKLKTYYGDKVQVHYFDLFDPTCPAIPPDGQLPVVLIDGKVFSCGGKISIPLLRRKIEELGSG